MFCKYHFWGQVDKLFEMTCLPELMKFITGDYFCLHYNYNKLQLMQSRIIQEIYLKCQLCFITLIIFLQCFKS
jgi:hypothetical protein